MICPLKGDCRSVMESEYSSFFGVPVEMLGMLYYVMVVAAYAVMLFVPAISSPFFVFAILAISTSAFLFSMYLTFVQIGVLKQICTWCLISAGLCTLIFSLALSGSDFAFIELLQRNKSLLVVVHLIGLALGVGGASSSDIFFFRALKDLRISQRETDVLRTLSQIIWFGLALLIISGAGLYLADIERLSESAKFLVKMVVVLVIVVNGAFLNLKITPKLIHISFGKTHEHYPGELRSIRKLAFALGAVSFVSWYTALVLGALRGVPLAFWQLLGIYVGLLAGAMIVSQVMERRLGQQEMPPHDVD